MSIDLLPRCADLGVPTHGLYGEFDQATPPALDCAIAERVPGATVKTLAGCGHCPALEAPGAFIAAVGEILR